MDDVNDFNSTHHDAKNLTSEEPVDNGGLLNGIPPSEIKFNSEKKNNKKLEEIEVVLKKNDVNIQKLKKLARSESGLVDDCIRKRVWPLLLDIVTDDLPPPISEKELEKHPEYQQVVLDVNRSLKRFPPGIPLEQRLSLQNQLTHLILRVVVTHPRLRYYQGYHDVAVTLLLVVGEKLAFYLLEKLSTNHLKECMEPTMDKTSHLLNYLYPLIKHQNKKVYKHLEESGVGTIFALPWFLTWFGHSLNHYSDVVRLYDYFLASEPLSPIYLSSVIVVHRADEILNTPCDMANIHFLLSQIPEDLPFEMLLKKTTDLYKKHPPDTIEEEVNERTRQEQEQRKRETAIMRQRLNQRNSILWRYFGNFYPIQRLPMWALQRLPFYRMTRYRYFVATATFVVGLYAYYLRTVDALDSSKYR